MARNQAAHGLEQEQRIAGGGAMQDRGKLRIGRARLRDQPDVLANLVGSQRLELDARGSMPRQPAQLARAVRAAPVALRGHDERGVFVQLRSR